MGIFQWMHRKKPQPADPASEGRLSYRVGELQGIGRRRSQEDACLFVNALDVTKIRQQGLLAVVSDGMGGMQDGRTASATAISCMQSWFGALDRDGDISQQLYEGILMADRQVYEVIGGDGGCTVIACLIYEEKLYYAGVGDSGLYLWRDSQLTKISREQNLLHEDYLRLIHRGVLRPDMVRGDQEAEALAQFVGMGSVDDVDQLRRPLLLQPRDVLLLCSDGISGVLTEEMLGQCLALSSPKVACAAMEEQIRRAALSHQDNYTALVIYCAE